MSVCSLSGGEAHSFVWVWLCSDRSHERLYAEDIHHARQIVGQYMQCHLGGDLRQTLHQKVRRSHPHLERTEWVLRGFAALAHGLWVLIETFLYRLQHVLMLPAR